MPLLKSRFKPRPYWQREALREKYDATLPTPNRHKRTSPIQLSRMRDYGIELRQHWQPDDSERPAGVSDTYRTPPLW